MPRSTLNDSAFGARMHGTGPTADLVGEVFRIARRRAGIPDRFPTLSVDAFRRPAAQRSLFDDA